MALADLTKQLAQQALLSATQEVAPAPAPPESAGSVILNQIGAMQKQLKDDEELVVFFQSGADRIRVLEIYLPSSRVVVLSGFDANRVSSRVVSAVEALQLITRVGKVQPAAKPIRINLVTPKSKDAK